MTVNGLGPFVFGDTFGIFVVLNCFPGAKPQFVSVCLWWEVKCAVQNITVDRCRSGCCGCLRYRRYSIENMCVCMCARCTTRCLFLP